ncbi:MAG TPA: hypothetical protein VHH36_02985, partial [Candidatus Thermoplasmatota archaeon]|nr:hypothetical protein [Candidatus Thermoplasmatota archaeon]
MEAKGASMPRPLLLVLAVVLALAGCASKNDGAPTPTPGASPDAPAMSSEQAASLLKQAAADLPARYGFDLKTTRDGAQLLTARGAFDNDTKASYVEIRGDAAAMGGAQAFARGVGIYQSSEGAAYALDGLTIVQPAALSQFEGVVPAQLFD